MSSRKQLHEQSQAVVGEVPRGVGRGGRRADSFLMIVVSVRPPNTLAPKPPMLSFTQNVTLFPLMLFAHYFRTQAKILVLNGGNQLRWQVRPNSFSLSWFGEAGKEATAIGAAGQTPEHNCWKNPRGHLARSRNDLGHLTPGHRDATGHGCCPLNNHHKKNPNFVEIGKEILVLHKVHQQINSNGLICITGNHSS